MGNRKPETSKKRKSKLVISEAEEAQRPYEAASGESSDIGGISTSFHTLNYLTEGGHQTMIREQQMGSQSVKQLMAENSESIPIYEPTALSTDLEAFGTLEFDLTAGSTLSLDSFCRL